MDNIVSMTISAFQKKYLHYDISWQMIISNVDMTEQINADNRTVW